MRYGMRQSRRERLLGFVVGVALCCMISGCLSILAKKGRDESITSTRTARLATPHDDMLLPGSELSGGPHPEERLSRPKGQVRDSLVTAVTLCLAAAMCCAITALGAVLLLRGGREGHGYFSEEENSDEYMSLMNRGSLIEVKTSESRPRKQKIRSPDLDEMTSEEVV